MIRVLGLVLVFATSPAFAAAPSPATTPVPNSQGAIIEGAFGLKFGQDVREYLEGHYANSMRMVEGRYDLMKGNDLRYMLLENTPLKLEKTFGEGARLTYMVLADRDIRAVEYALDVYLPGQCQSHTAVKAVFEHLSAKYDAAPFTPAPQPPLDPAMKALMDKNPSMKANYEKSQQQLLEMARESAKNKPSDAKFQDKAGNKIWLTCQGSSILSLRYTSNLFEQFIASLEDAQKREIEASKGQIGDGL